MSIAKHAAELALRESIALLEKDVFQGDRFDGWRKKGGHHDGPEMVKRMKAYMADMNRAIDYYEEVLKHFEALP